MKRTRLTSLRLALLVGSVGLTAACGPELIGNPLPDDLDGDGYFVGEDCDDQDDLVHPEAEETIDGRDNDCDGDVDCSDDDVRCPLIDEDGDGWLAAEDCDDQNAEVNPDALESCEDLVDNDCDGVVDWEDVDCAVIGNG